MYLTSVLVSGEPPKKPVFSKATGTLSYSLVSKGSNNLFLIGNVFEKHLLESYLAEHQTDPITNEPATIDDYVELKGVYGYFF